MCKASVQGERAWGEELHMGMGGCSAAPIGCFVAQIQGGMAMVGGEGGLGGVSLQGERARRVCKGGRASYGDGGLMCGSCWLLLCFLWVVEQIQ